jgi:hypothetical protein
MDLIDGRLGDGVEEILGTQTGERSQLTPVLSNKTLNP